MIPTLSEHIINRIAMVILNLDYTFCLLFRHHLYCFAAIILWILSASALLDIPICSVT